MKRACHTFTDPEDNFLITSPSYPTMVQSTLPPFLKLMDGLGRLNQKDNSFKLYRGGTVWLRTETDPDSIVGITNVRHIWGDEAGKYRLYFWQNMQARADFCGCPIDLTTSPYSLNWIKKELIDPWRKGERSDVEVIQAASWENPYHSLHDPEKLSEKRRTMDIRRFNMIYGGEWTKMEGLVYDCWDDDLNLVDPFLLPSGTKIYAGIDWGYHPDPFAMKIRAVTLDGRHYGISEIVRTRMTITDIVKEAHRQKTIHGIQTFFCDPSQPGYIEEFNRAGLSALPADNDIRRGVDLHYELIKQRKYKEFRGMCPHSADERETYHYPEPKDLKPDQDSKEMNPVDSGNHCMDSDRYLTAMTYRREQARAPLLMGQGKPAKTRIEQLMRKPRRDAEKWS
jgi:hypothetical protein